MMNADTLLMLGTDFPFISSSLLSERQTVVQVDVRGEQLGRRCKVDFGFVGDTKTTLRALLPRLEQNQNEAHLKESVEHYREARRDLDKLASGDTSGKTIHPQYVAAASLINSRPTMPSSVSTSERRSYGLHAICG